MLHALLILPCSSDMDAVGIIASCSILPLYHSGTLVKIATVNDSLIICYSRVRRRPD